MVNLLNKSPFFLMSFPRSGSNFIKNVVSKSSGKKCATIYDTQNEPIEKPSDFLVLKSHAVNYSTLLAEVGRFCPFLSQFPHKFIILWRDPRDAMISYYDWYVNRTGQDLTQREFLYHTPYSAVLSGQAQEKTIVGAYKKFYEHWFKLNDPCKNTIHVRFEKLIENKENEFERIFQFLDLDKKANEASFNELVKTGRSSRDTRGVKESWKLYSKEYEVLLEIVEMELSNEINQIKRLM